MVYLRLNKLARDPAPDYTSSSIGVRSCLGLANTQAGEPFEARSLRPGIRFANEPQRSWHLSTQRGAADARH